MPLVRVAVPADIRPGQPFLVNADSGVFHFTCPPNVAEGGHVLVDVPAAPPEPVQPAAEGSSSLVNWSAPRKPSIGSSSPMRANGKAENLLDDAGYACCGGGSLRFASFGGRASRFPHWVVFDMGSSVAGQLVAGAEVLPFSKHSSPTRMSLHASDGGDAWRPLCVIEATAPWSAARRWSWDPGRAASGRYLRLTFESTFNGDAPTISHVLLFPPSRVCV